MGYAERLFVQANRTLTAIGITKKYGRRPTRNGMLTQISPHIRAAVILVPALFRQAARMTP